MNMVVVDTLDPSQVEPNDYVRFGKRQGFVKEVHDNGETFSILLVDEDGEEQYCGSVNLNTRIDLLYVEVPVS